MAKQRSKITDARVLLTKKQRQTPRMTNAALIQSGGLKTKMSNAALIQSGGLKTRKNRLRSKPILIDDDDDEDMVVDLSEPAPLLRRTVKNNYVLPRTLASMPPLPTFNRTVDTDPFDCYQTYDHRPPFPQEPISMPHIDAAMLDDYYKEPAPKKGILRVTKYNAPAPSNALKARLYSSPDPHAPTGIFARDRDPDKELLLVDPQTSGYRIVVSNLHPSVTQSDIQELFEDIGELIEARLVRPGVAEVIYKRLNDAEGAVETYHNRQLDGQPMKCLLVKPRSSNKPTAPAVRLENPGRQPIDVDMDTLHKVLFRRK